MYKKSLKYFGILGILMLLVSCGGGSGGSSDGDDEVTPSLKSFQGMPDLDFSLYDTSSSNYTSPTSSVAAKSLLPKVVTLSDPEELSKAGCKVKDLKNLALSGGVIAQGFMCLYKISEENYGASGTGIFEVPEDEFAYYSIKEIDPETEEEVILLSRIGYFSEGYGDITEPVMVIDECEGSTQTARVRITSAEVDEELSELGFGYYIQMLENFSDEETFQITADTREPIWVMQSEFVEGDDEEYKSVSLSYDTENEYNLMQAFSFISEGDISVSMNSVFGASSDLPDGYSAGGSAIVDLDGTSLSEGYVFNDSETVPAIVLEGEESDKSDLPFYAEVVGMGDLIDVESPGITAPSNWDCISGSGVGFVTIDLTPTAIDSALVACEIEEDDVLEEIDEAGCANL